MPSRQPGQYEDVETGLYYNRFRYYDSNTGTYISQDPIGLAGNNPNFYAYVHDSNAWVDPFGLDLHHIIPNQIFKEFRKNFKNVSGYIQNVSKKAVDVSNLIDLPKPFHGNHPAYSDYVRKKVQQLVDTGKLDLQNIKKLQDHLIDKIKKAKISGKKLNDFFKGGCK
ncbi:MAG: AHH domain-containing protein [Apibacter sp.]|nr:AHH domain-containing protein [Apibacter sp.]